MRMWQAVLGLRVEVVVQGERDQTVAQVEMEVWAEGVGFLYMSALR